jgi:hypothetical protein
MYNINKFTMTRYIISVITLLSVVLPVVAKIQHPSLLFTTERVTAAVERAKTDTIQARAWNDIKSTAENLLAKNDYRRMEYMALAYQVTGDNRYFDKLRIMLLDIAKIDSWADKEMMQRTPAWRSELQMAHKSYQIAVAFDAIYNKLSASDRKTIANGVWRLAGEPLLGDWLLEPSRIHSLNSMGHNWWTSCVGMGGLLALSISNEVPEAEKAAQLAVEALPEWFEFAGDVIQNKPKTFDDAGGMYESINYASFGITEAMLLRQAWLNSHPGAKLETLQQMQLFADFFAHASYPRSGMLYSINFGDSHKNVTGESSMFLAYSMGVKDATTLWYATQVEQNQHREGFPRNYPMGFLYTPDLTNAPSEPNIAKSKLWPDFGWATMRNSWKKDATMLAVKSGMTWNHSHADANSFILFHNGEDIIKDAGNCSYGNDNYRKYFFQSDAHNVVKFNGKGQSTYQQYHGTMLSGSLHYLLDGSDVRYVLADGTGPMSDSFARNFRHFLWLDNVVFIIDDIKSHEPGQFEWLWHPGGKTVKKGGTLEVTKENSSVVVMPLYPEMLAPSNYVHDYPEMLYWEVREAPDETLKNTEEYYSFILPGNFDRIKAVNAIILKDSPNQQTLPTIERREGKDWIGVQIKWNGKITDLYINQLADGRLMHANSWIEADGWQTDAYMFAVTYPEGKTAADAERLFMFSASSLRRADKVWFSSLAKLNFIAKSNGGALDLQLNGQPRYHFGINLQKTFNSVKLNGDKVPFSKENNLYTFKGKL